MLAAFLGHSSTQFSLPLLYFDRLFQLTKVTRLTREAAVATGHAPEAVGLALLDEMLIRGIPCDSISFNAAISPYPKTSLSVS